MSAARVTVRGYDDLQSIGSGGFSEVFQARQADLNRRVALKVIKPAEAGYFDRNAFATECHAMGAVSNHPNIVTLYSHGFTEQGQPFLAMELYRETLLDQLRRSDRLSVEQVLDVGIALSAAIDRAHAVGIIHCDIKPHNVFFSEYGEPALGDFGIAALSTGSDGAQAAGVTLHYAAPEVLEDESPSELSDIYSLGATLYSALAGRQPFRGHGASESVDVVRRRIIADPVPAITEQAVPPVLDALLEQMLAKDPQKRPRSASEVQGRLERMKARLFPADSLEDLTIPRPSQAPGDYPPPPTPRADDPNDDPNDDPTTALAPRPSAVTPTNRRAALALLLAGAVVLSALVAILLVGRGPDGQDETAGGDVPDFSTSTTSVVTVPDRPAAPEGVRFDVADDGSTVVSWETSARAAKYEVRVSDEIAASGGTVIEPQRDETVIEPQLVLPASSTDVIGRCVQVRAVGEGGRVSDWTQQRCS